MNGLEEYSREMFDRTRATVEGILATNRSGLEKVFTNQMLKLPGPHVLDRTPPRDERLLVELFFGFSEIFGSYNALKELATLPITGKRLSPVQYIRMNIECYLTEVYILQQRLLAYLKVIEKAARTAAATETYKRALRVVPLLKKSVYRKFESICGVRGSHIHETRYDDEDLRRVSTLEHLVNPGRMLELRTFYRNECKELRMKWGKKISGNNAKTAAFLDLYFGGLYLIVFSPKDGILGRTSKNSAAQES